MATGDSLYSWVAAEAVHPASNAAQFDDRNGHRVVAFDADTDEDTLFEGVLPRQYSGLGITARVCWAAETASIGNVRWRGSFERHEDDVTDLDSDSFTTPEEVTDAAASGSGEPSYVDIPFADGSEIDDLGVGESFRFKLGREGTDATNDTMLNDAQIKSVELRET